MSFGFSIGDFITAIELVNQLRKDFAGAPSQFNALSDEYGVSDFTGNDGLMNILLDSGISRSWFEIWTSTNTTSLSTKQRGELQEIAKSCRGLFGEIKHLIRRYCEINESHGIRKTWKRLRWEPEDARDLRNRLSSNISTLNAFNGRITRDNMSMLLKHKANQKHRICLDWLAPTTHTARQSEYIRLREPGTGQWLIQSHEFQSWNGGKRCFCLVYPVPAKPSFHQS